MKQFEIPYNFDLNLIIALYKLNITDLFHCIYVPPYWEDYVSAKYNYIHHNGINMQNNKKMTREEYEFHISYINAYFPDKLMLLLQQNNQCISNELLSYYYNLGFHKFCVGNLKQAQQIKTSYPNDEIIGSITMKIMPKDLKDKRYEIFDGFVLWFPYNRNLKMIQSLPKNYKYILLVNCDCSIYCQGSHHWFANHQEEQVLNCPKPKTWENIIRIDPCDLSLFDPYISYFKLQGREYSTNELLKDIILYTTNYKYLNPSFEINQNKYQTIGEFNE